MINPSIADNIMMCKRCGWKGPKKDVFFRDKEGNILDGSGCPNCGADDGNNLCFIDQPSSTNPIMWLVSEYDEDDPFYVGYKRIYPTKEDFKAAVEKESPDCIVLIEDIEESEYKRKEVWAVHVDALRERGDHHE